MSSVAHPTFCRIEYWNQNTGEWVVAHAGINLLKPAAYVQKLAKTTIARVVEVDSGVITYGTDGADLL